MKYIDLTRTFTDGMPVYPGDPAPRLQQTADFDSGGYVEYEVHTGMHAGTHIDAPLHMVPGGKMLADFPVEAFCGRGVLVDARGKSRIDATVLANLALTAGDVVLIMTGWSEKFGQPEYYVQYPEITADAARRLVEAKIKMVGLDGPSPDRAPYEIHKIFLSSGILIAENLTSLLQLAGQAPFEIFALPAKFAAEAAPARVIARMP